MTNSNTVQVDTFKVSFTKELRDLFKRTHDKMSAHLPAERQFGTEEQLEMVAVCHEVPDEGATAEDYEKRESDLCELLDYLAASEVPFSRIHHSIRRYSSRTIGVAIRLNCARWKAHNEAKTRQEEAERRRQTSELEFRSPMSRTLVGATA